MSKIKLSMQCPHCSADNITEVNEYHEVIHGEYFKGMDVLKFEDLKSEKYPEFLISDAYHYVKPFLCSSCGNRMKVNYHQPNQYSYLLPDFNRRNCYKVEKSGDYLDNDMIKRFFKYLQSKERGIPKDSKSNKCQKEIFTNRLWKKVSKQFTNRPFQIKIDHGRDIAYVMGISYHLGWSEEIDIYFVNIYGKMYTVTLNENDLMNLEFLHFPDDTAKAIMENINKM